MKLSSIFSIALASTLLTHGAVQAQPVTTAPIPQTTTIDSIAPIIQPELHILESQDRDRTEQLAQLRSELSYAIGQIEGDDQQLAFIEQLAKRYPKSPVIQLSLANHLAFMGELTTKSPATLKKAEQIYQQIIQDHPTHPLVAFDYGFFLKQYQRPQEMQNLYEKLLQTHPKYLEHYLNYAVLDDDNPSIFFSIFDRALTAMPNDSLVYLKFMDRLEAYGFAKRSDKGIVQPLIDRTKTALKIMPKDPQIWAMLVRLHLWIDQPKEAITQANTAIQRVGEAGYFKMLLGDAELLLNNNPKGAIAHYQAAIKAGGSFCIGEFDGTRAARLQEQSSTETVIDLMQRSLRTKPTVQAIDPKASQESCKQPLSNLIDRPPSQP